MKKTLLICAVAILALGLTGTVVACDKDAAGAKTADAKEGCCPKAAAKAAYDASLADSGCAKTAQKAANDAMATAAYKNTYAETGCSKSATKAAYAAVQEASGCSKSATSAAATASCPSGGAPAPRSNLPPAAQKRNKSSSLNPKSDECSAP